MLRLGCPPLLTRKSLPVELGPRVMVATRLQAQRYLVSRWILLQVPIDGVPDLWVVAAGCGGLCALWEGEQSTVGTLSGQHSSERSMAGCE